MSLPDTAPREGLLQEILAAVERQEQTRAARRRFWGFLFLCGASLWAVISMSMALAADLRHSGFLAFASLLFTNGGDVLANWREFSYSLLESLPVTELILTLGLGLAGMYASRSLLTRHERLWTPNA